MAGRSFHLFRRYVLVCLALLVLAPTLKAQDTTHRPVIDTLAPPPDTTGNHAMIGDTTASIIRASRAPHSPRKAALYSAILPGLGQAYNHEYWKMPLVYAAIGTCTYFFVWNMNEYRTFRDAYRMSMDGNPETNAPDPFLAKQSSQYLKAYRDYYRQNVDYSVLFFVLAYTLNIADATVFAHLRNWDMSDDLSMRVSPAIINNRSLGISVKLAIGGGKKNQRTAWMAGR
ncbi:DUF5683 domain-containing protein [Chitinophaga qingshengii]|uniref:DUF5683 domain-containing protein n=1 Tax=Chitinophaga qingshengii TaxID=1569794 RepID=A0ABR7TKZ6_9BACT|nr:hypothetical protein [Chitinophaga qingshengii]